MSGYPVEAQQVLASIEERSPWFGYRNEVILGLLGDPPPPSLWEVGSGNGFVARAISQKGVEVVAVEPGVPGAEAAAARGLVSVQARLEDLELPAGSLTAIGLFDVIEHLEAPEALLAEAHRVLAPGGTLLVAVPALPWLWSEADVSARHLRRYTRRSLERLLSGSGFRREELRYLFGALVVPVLLGRALPSRFGRRRRVEPKADLAPRGAINAAGWSVLIVLERAIAALGGPPLGTSVAGRFRRV